MEMSHLLDTQLAYIVAFGDADSKKAAAEEIAVRANLTYS